MSSHQYRLVIAQLGHDRVVPIRQHTGHDVPQAFGPWQETWVKQPIAPVVHGVLGAAGINGRRRNIKTATPDIGLLGPVSFGGFLLVEPL